MRERANLSEALVRLVAEGRPFVKKVTAASYEKHFTVFLEGCARLLPSIEKCGSCLEDVASDTVERLEAEWKSSGKRFFDIPSMEDKIVIAIYLVPAFQELNNEPASILCEKLRNAWLKKYPKSPFQIGSYEKILAGFKPGHKLCFITTAVCENEGKPDNCCELTAFRNYRDHWLIHQAGGREQIETYYHVAPIIVTLIGLTESDSFYAFLRTRYLEPCLEKINAERLEDCRSIYTSMVENLCARYMIT